MHSPPVLDYRVVKFGGAKRRELPQWAIKQMKKALRETQTPRWL